MDFDIQERDASNDETDILISFTRVLESSWGPREVTGSCVDSDDIMNNAVS